MVAAVIEWHRSQKQMDGWMDGWMDGQRVLALLGSSLSADIYTVVLTLSLAAPLSLASFRCWF